MRFTSVTVLALSAAASATALLPRDNCNTGPIQCCNQLQNVTSTGISQILGGFSLLGLPLNIGAILGNTNALLGLTCSPLSVAGLGGNSCSTQPVCCTDNSFGGILSLGCTPININA